MSYRSISDILPKELVEQLQEYVEGRVIYIPKKESNKKQWGACTDTKQALARRNQSIYLDFQSGMTIKQLANKYFLVEKSIQRILQQEKNN